MYLNKDIQKLCRQVSQETDQDRLLSLVNQLNSELDQASESENPPKPRKTADNSTEKQSAESSHGSGKKPDAA